MSETERVNPVTHPTEVIRRVVRAAERADRLTPLQRQVMGWTAAMLLLSGVICAVLGVLTHSVGLVAGGAILAPAGLCVSTLELLLLPEEPSRDVRFVQWLREWRDR